jgi:hypothetical protein
MGLSLRIKSSGTDVDDLTVEVTPAQVLVAEKKEVRRASLTPAFLS